MKPGFAGRRICAYSVRFRMEVSILVDYKETEFWRKNSVSGITEILRNLAEKYWQMLKSVVLCSRFWRQVLGRFRLGWAGAKNTKKSPRKVLTICGIRYIIVMCCVRAARRVCRAFGQRREKYELHSRQLLSRGSTSGTLRRHVLSEDNISVSVWRVFQPSWVSPENRTCGFRGFVDSDVWFIGKDD